jgi:hypothetical protein
MENFIFVLLIQLEPHKGAINSVLVALLTHFGTTFCDKTKTQINVLRYWLQVLRGVEYGR